MNSDKRDLIFGMDVAFWWSADQQRKDHMLHIQCVDPSGQVRIIKSSEFPLILGTILTEKDQLRDPKLVDQAIQITQHDSDLVLKVLQQGIHIQLGDLKLQSLHIPLQIPLKVGDTELTFSWDEFSDTVIEFPKGEQPWYTESESGLELLRAVKKNASSNLSLYLYGETGTGKEVLAKLIHLWSERAGGPFVPINCGALPLSVVESELFGHVKGSFTGAVRDRPGALLQAHGGTLFLDEVADLPTEIQVKLLRFLESGEIRPVGSDRFLHADVRIVCATHKPLAKMVKEGKFRHDLYFRLASVPFEIPPLRNRPEDIENLSMIFAKEFGKIITKEALFRLKSYSWPGNVRELRHAIERACGGVNASDILLYGKEFDFLIDQAGKDESPRYSEVADMTLPGVYNLKEMEKVLVLRALKMAKGNRSQAAKILGVARSTLFEMLKRYKIVGPKSTDYWLFQGEMKIMDRPVEQTV